MRVGLAPSRTRDGVRLVNTEYTPGGEWRHTQDLFLEFLDAVGVERPDPLEWEITLSEQEEKSAAEAFFSASEGATVVGLVLGTANPAKDWPTRPIRVARTRSLEIEFGFHVLLLGGPGEGEQATEEAILDDGESHREVRAVRAL